MKDHSDTIIRLLERFDIPYWEAGKNVSEGITINVECPLCDDVSNHCGIFRNSMEFHCWKCGRKGNLTYLLARITHRPIEFFLEEIKASGITFEQDSEQIIKDIFAPTELKIAEKRSFTVKLPEYFKPVQAADSVLLEDYMLRRNISLDVLIQHQCGICEVGEYMNRLIIPVVFEEVLVGFQAADMTGKSETKYKADSKDSEIKNYFYGWDTLNMSLGYVVVIEGVLDKWRLGSNALASFGITLTDKQKRLLIDLRPRKLIFAPDGDAYLDACRQSQEFTPFIEEVYVVQLPDYWIDFNTKISEDPDSLGTEKVWELIQNECFIER